MKQKVILILLQNTKKTLENTDGLELEFIVNRGENIIIDNVHLSGAKKFSYSDIEPAVVNKEKELWDGCGDAMMEN